MSDPAAFEKLTDQLTQLLVEAANKPNRDEGNQLFAATLAPFSHAQLVAIVASLARPLFRP
jgi:hypothetical protein